MRSHNTTYMTEKESLTELARFAERRDAEWVEASKGAWTEEYARSFSAADRRKAAKEGAALPDGSYPIYNQADLDNAVRLASQGDAPEDRVKAHILKRARQLGLKPPANLDPN